VNIKRVSYFHTTIQARHDEAYGLLTSLADSGVNLLAFSATPVGDEHTQLMIFPESVTALAAAAEKAGLSLTGPEHALLCRGDDKLAALVDIHRRLSEADVHVFSSSGVTADCGRFGYVVYVKAGEFEDAARALGI